MKACDNQLLDTFLTPGVIQVPGKPEIRNFSPSLDNPVVQIKPWHFGVILCQFPAQIT